jgi:cytochrome c
MRGSAPARRFRETPHPASLRSAALSHKGRRRRAATVVAVWVAALIPAARADDLARGRELFAPCRSCHAREAGADGMAGPSLAGLNGRRVGGDERFDYSDVFRKAFASGATWDEARLMAFLADGEEMFPGMWMSARPLPRAEDRRALAAYLLQDGP